MRWINVDTLITTISVAVLIFISTIPYKLAGNFGLLLLFIVLLVFSLRSFILESDLYLGQLASFTSSSTFFSSSFFSSWKKELVWPPFDIFLRILGIYLRSFSLRSFFLLSRCVTYLGSFLLFFLNLHELTDFVEKFVLVVRLHGRQTERLRLEWGLVLAIGPPTLCISTRVRLFDEGPVALRETQVTRTRLLPRCGCAAFSFRVWMPRLPVFIDNPLQMDGCVLSVTDARI